MTTTKSQKLEDQAAAAALYVTQGKDQSQTSSSTIYPLDKDGKLSSAGAATSLKHATPRELPSFPSVGLAHTESASGAAASLANANQKTFEHWKPGEIPAANKAALTAKDHKAPELWQPELSAAGSKAALLAQRDGGNVDIWRPEETEAGQSAAGQAMRKKGLGPQVSDSLSAEAGRRALVAATGAVTGSRRRAGSTPIETPAYPDAANSASNALRAANSVSKRPGKTQAGATASNSSQIDAARIHNQAITNLSREMYTSHPPVAPEIEEKNKQAGLRAAAVSMAKRMYEMQQKQIEEAADLSRSDSQFAATSVHNRPASSASSDDSHQPPKYTNLQEAAKKLAAERLAKLHDEHAAYRTYYGTQAEPQTRRLSVRGRTRGRASSESELNDEERAQQVRAQMSLFTDKLAQVDLKKRQNDRDLLMVAAQKNVKAKMQGMDEKVFNETGKISPAMMEEWEAKAKAKAQAESEVRMVNHGKVHIGGGKFLDQSEVDAIASAKVQPTLDEITLTAERQRARDEELRQQQLERERLAAAKVADDKERANKAKEDWRRFKEEEKREKQAKKDEAKAKKLEEKRLREEERRKPREDKEITTSTAIAGGAVAGGAIVAAPEAAEETVDQSQPEHTAKDDPVSETEELASGSGDGPDLEKYDTAETGVDVPEDESIDPVTTTKDDQIEPTTTAPITAPITAPATAPVTAPEEEGQKATSSAGEPAPVTPGTKHETPLATRIAPPVAAASAGGAAAAGLSAPTTETTVSGPNKSPKEKDSGKVSSWLKSKLRRASKPTKPEQTIASSAQTPGVEKEKGATAVSGTSAAGAGTVTSAATEASGATSSDPGDSMREVAMAGKSVEGKDFALSAHPPTTSSAAAAGAIASDSKAPIVSPASEELNADLYDNDSEDEVQHHHQHRESTSSPEISSLSSDEDPRGRSAIRLADSMNLPTNQAAQQPANKRAGMVVPDMPIDVLAASGHAGGTSSTTGNEHEQKHNSEQDPATVATKKVAAEGLKTEDIEATEEEDLAPPPATVPAAKALEPRASASPKRDSKFVEAL